MDKEERKQFVKEQRQKFKQNPSNFFKEYYWEPTKHAWKTQPLKETYTLIKWAIIYALIFGTLYSINNDMIYCDATINKYDGKLMYTYNKFVQHYNTQAKEMQENYNPYNTIDAQQKIENFNKKYSMYCTYNLTRYWQEPLYETKTNKSNYCDQLNGCTTGKIETTLHNFKKIITKQR